MRDQWNPSLLVLEGCGKPTVCISVEVPVVVKLFRRLLRERSDQGIFPDGEPE